jgi:hypothetical protein
VSRQGEKEMINRFPTPQFVRGANEQGRSCPSCICFSTGALQVRSNATSDAILLVSEATTMFTPPPSFSGSLHLCCHHPPIHVATARCQVHGTHTWQASWLAGLSWQVWPTKGSI